MRQRKRLTKDSKLSFRPFWSYQCNEVQTTQGKRAIILIHTDGCKLFFPLHEPTGQRKDGGSWRLAKTWLWRLLFSQFVKTTFKSDNPPPGLYSRRTISSHLCMPLQGSNHSQFYVHLPVVTQFGIDKRLTWVSWLLLSNLELLSTNYASLSCHGRTQGKSEHDHYLYQ